MENFRSLLQRTLRGARVSVETLYLDEQAFRYNNRKPNDGRRFDAMEACFPASVSPEKALGGSELAA